MSRDDGGDKSVNSGVQRDQSGLNPNRVRGFGSVSGGNSAPSLNEMRAKQGAIVSKFMTCTEQ